MTENDTSAMVVAGQRGGKSTFIGAFTAYVRDIEADKWQGQFNMRYGQRSEFTNHIYKCVESHYKYPQQTDRLDPYVITVKINTDDGMSAERHLTMMDIPGESQEDAKERLKDGNINKEEIKESYENGIGNNKSIRQKVDDGEALDIGNTGGEEKDTLYLYQYVSANTVIFILNLWKFIERPNLDPVLTPDLIERVAEKKNCLLLVTAADMIDYNPNKFRSGILAKLMNHMSVSTRWFDYHLYEYIQDTKQLPANQRTTDIEALLQAAKNNDVSMFSVAVPASSQAPDSIAVQGGAIKTQGFDNVVKWLMEV